MPKENDRSPPLPQKKKIFEAPRKKLTEQKIGLKERSPRPEEGRGGEGRGGRGGERIEEKRKKERNKRKRIYIITLTVGKDVQFALPRGTKN